jgi:Phytanoyl-CoA dioxygenase (PhyH)
MLDADRLTGADVGYFQAFGFVRLERFFSEATIAALGAEFDAELTAGFGDTSSPTGDEDGRDGFFLPLMTSRTETSVRLVEELAPLARTLLGREVLPSYAEGSVYFGPTPWHLDSSSRLKSIRFTVYLEPLVDDVGAMLFLPGSHHPAYRESAQAYLRTLDEHDEEAMLASLEGVPTYAVPSVPGDLIVLDEHVWHCSGVRPARRQWGMTYVVAPQTEEEIELAGRFYRAEFIPTSDRGYDGAAFPYYDPEWLERHPDAEELRRVGAVAAAQASALS